MADDISAATSARSLPRHALIFGGVAGVIGAALSWAQFAFGFYGRAVWFLLLFVPMIAIILGVQRWRDGVLGGTIRFSQAFGSALAIGLVYALSQGGFAWLLVHHLEPSLLDTMAAFQRDAMQTAGRTAQEIAAAEQEFRERFSPATYPKAVFTTSLLISFIASLLASLFVRRQVR